VSHESEPLGKLLLAVLVLGGMGYLAHDRVVGPRGKEVARLEQRLEDLRSQNGRVRILTKQVGRAELEDQLTAARQQLARMERLIASADELPDLLEAISNEARRTGAELSQIQPVTAEEDEFYIRRTYELAVLGSYHQIAEFLTRAASLPRIVTPTDLRVTVRAAQSRSGDPQLEARFAIETYVLPGALDARSRANPRN
jgi:type IV pilus assembly protein PilO